MNSEWLLDNCRFAQAYPEGPLPRRQYFSGDNPYGNFIPMEVLFDPKAAILKVQTTLGDISLNLTEDQVRQLSKTFEHDVRKDYWEGKLSTSLSEIAKHIMQGKGIQHNDWSWTDDEDGLHIYSLPDMKPIHDISLEELKRHYGIMVNG